MFKSKSSGYGSTPSISLLNLCAELCQYQNSKLPKNLHAFDGFVSIFSVVGDYIRLLDKETGIGSCVLVKTVADALTAPFVFSSDSSSLLVLTSGGLYVSSASTNVAP